MNTCLITYYGREIQRKIEDEFIEVLRLMNFGTKGSTYLEDGMLMVEYSIKRLLIEKTLKRVL